MNDRTKKYSSEEISSELEKLGSSIGVSSSDDGIVFTVSSLKKNLDKTLELLEERMLNPNFDEDAFKRIKRQLLERMKNSRTQATSVASVVYAKLNYGSGNILAIPDEGTQETVNNIQFTDIQKYYDSYLTSEDGRVVIVGDIKESELTSKLSFLSKLPKRSFTLPIPPTAPAIEKTRIYIVDIPNAAQTEFRVGNITGLKYDALGDYYKAYLSNYALGGAFNSRINLNLREDKGWTYGARSNFSGNKYTGIFTFSSGIRADATDSALYEVINELKQYAANGIKPEEISFMKNSIGQADARSYETGIQKATFVGRIQQYNLPADYVKRQTAILNSITKKEIDALTKKYIDINKMNIVLVGDKNLVVPGLKRLGYEIIELDADGKEVGKL
jgi:zinc protease